MKAWKPLAVGIASVAIATATLVPVFRARSVRLLPQTADRSAPPQFDRAQSAALFIGVRKFTHDALEVPFAADDAVDLAYVFAFDPRVSLVPPQRVILALSGTPRKEESRRRLQELKDAGAQIGGADPSDILTFLQRQAALAGRDGILIVSIATHGFVRDGAAYILGSTSLFRHHDTALPAAKIFDIAGRSAARRSLLFVDACRERIDGITRTGSADPITAAPLVSRMRRIEGQVIFYAAAAGKYAYDDPVSQNGVFTKAVLDGLNCSATATRGIVTAGTLRTWVEDRVLAWIHKNRDPSAVAATQVSLEGDTHNMPLSVCWRPPRPAEPDEPARVTVDGSIIRAFDLHNTSLWQHDLGGRVIDASVIDLNADGKQEIVAGTAASLVAFDERGRRLWSTSEKMPLQKFVIGRRWSERTPVIAALFPSRIALYGSDGKVLATWDHPAPLRNLAMDRPTSRHARRIIVTSGNRVFLIDPRKMKPMWHGAVEPESERIESLEILDHDNDEVRDIAIRTTGGHTFVLDFKGKVVSSPVGVRWQSHRF